MRKRKELQRVISEKHDIQLALNWAKEFIERGLQAGPVRLSIGRPRRTVDQNSKLWPLLKDVSKQVEWYGQYLEPEDWKHVFTASLVKQKAVPGIDGGFVICGISSSKMSKQLFCQLVELIYAFGSEHEVKWSEPKKTGEELWKEND